jgi:hypothetical protein
MALWIYSTIKVSSDVDEAVAGTIAVGVLLLLWVVGDVILGLLVLLSRGRKVTIERTID